MVTVQQIDVARLKTYLKQQVPTLAKQFSSSDVIVISLLYLCHCDAVNRTFVFIC
jgi:hypothetical protein